MHSTCKVIAVSDVPSSSSVDSVSSSTSSSISPSALKDEVAAACWRHFSEVCSGLQCTPHISRLSEVVTAFLKVSSVPRPLARVLSFVCLRVLSRASVRASGRFFCLFSTLLVYSVKRHVDFGKD